MSPYRDGSSGGAPLTPEEQAYFAQYEPSVSAPPAAASPPAQPSYYPPNDPTVTPPIPYDPGQDTQGMQAQPNYIAPAPYVDPATNADASRATGYDAAPVPSYVDAGPAPEYAAQTAYPSPSPQYFGPPASQGEQYNRVNEWPTYDKRVPFPGQIPRNPELLVDRIRQRVGFAGSWFDTPTTPGSIGDPPPDTGRDYHGINPVQVALKGAKFLKNFGPGGPGNLVGDVINDVLPYDQTNLDILKDNLTPSGATPFPEAGQHLVSLARYVMFRPQGAGTRMDPGSQEYMDRHAGDYLGNDPQYLARMAGLPWYLRPARPMIAQAAHALADLPYPGWEAPMMPKFLPDPNAPDSIDLAHGDVSHMKEHIEPNAYYDDPYIPGPDRRRPRYPEA